jgi:transcriptional regulatory protein LevR
VAASAFLCALICASKLFYISAPYNIREAESECARLEEQCDDARRDVKYTENLLRQLSDHFDELISWAELYDSASLEKKKMVVNALINRIEVSRDYKVKIDFNFDFEQFTNGHYKTGAL